LSYKYNNTFNLKLKSQCVFKSNKQLAILRIRKCFIYYIWRSISFSYATITTDQLCCKSEKSEEMLQLIEKVLWGNITY